jgi:hypothetical protein
VKARREVGATVVGAEELRVDRFHERDGVARDQGGDHGQEHRGKQVRRGTRLALQDSPGDDEARPDRDEHERQHESRIAEPVHDEAGLMVLVSAFDLVEDVQPQPAAVGQHEREKRNGGRTREQSVVAVGSGLDELGHRVSPSDQWC